MLVASTSVIGACAPVLDGNSFEIGISNSKFSATKPNFKIAFSPTPSAELDDS